MKTLLFLTPFIFSACNLLDAGNPIDAKLGANQCIQDNKGVQYKVSEVMKKHYKYNRLSDNFELVYPIVLVDKQYQVIDCPE